MLKNVTVNIEKPDGFRNVGLVHLGGNTHERIEIYPSLWTNTHAHTRTSWGTI